MASPKNCKECNNPMIAIICSPNPPASEWYCEECKISEYMNEPGAYDYWQGEPRLGLK